LAQLPRGGDRKSDGQDQRTNSSFDPTIAEAAKRLNVGTTIVKEAKTVLQSAEQTKAVEAGQKSVHKAATEIKQARAEQAAPTPEDAVKRDATGYPIPEPLIALWDRAPEVDGMRRQLTALCRLLCDAADNDDLFYRTTDLELVIDRLDEAYMALAAAVPYAVCAHCREQDAGNPCPICQGRRLISKSTFDKCIPENLKKNRAAPCA
jgi:hypothetical protein